MLALIQDFGPGFRASSFEYFPGCEERKGYMGYYDKSTDTYHASSVETLPVVLASVPQSKLEHFDGDCYCGWIKYIVDGSPSGVQRIFVVHRDDRVRNFPYPY